MRLVFVFVTIFSCLIISCSKTNSGLLVNKEELSGTWLLQYYKGGISYSVIVPTDSVVFTFDKSGRYTSTRNDTLQDIGNFEITTVSPDDDYYGSKIVINLFSDAQITITYGISIINDSLFLRDGYSDGYEYSYARLQ